MSAETLRRAAALMRERAEAATDGLWSVASVSGQGFAVHQGEHTTVSLFSARYDAEHIASWHPAVALAVADWLDREAGQAERCYGDPAGGAPIYGVADEAAVTVARTYLGES